MASLILNRPAFGLRSSDDEWSSSARSGHDRYPDDRRRRDYSPDSRRGGEGERGRYGGLQGRRSRSRDDMMDLERDRRGGGGGGRGGRLDYDDSFLREAMERKKLGEQQRARSRERLDSESDRSDRPRGPRGPPPLPQNPPSGNPGRHADYAQPPLPPPYSDDESVSSSKRSNLRKVSRPKPGCVRGNVLPHAVKPPEICPVEEFWFKMPLEKKSSQVLLFLA